MQVRRRPSTWHSRHPNNYVDESRVVLGVIGVLMVICFLLGVAVG